MLMRLLRVGKLMEEGWKHREAPVGAGDGGRWLMREGRDMQMGLSDPPPPPTAAMGWDPNLRMRSQLRMDGILITGSQG